MFKRARRGIEKSEKEHKLGLTSEVKEELGLNVDDTESSSESGSESSGSERPRGKRKRLLKDVGGDDDVGESDSRGSEGEEEENSEPDEGDEMGTEGGPTVDSALKDPLFFVSEDLQACVVCPGKLLKNQRMVELHTGAMHHIRRYTRFKQTVERLSTRFDDTNSDFAVNIVRVMDSVQQSEPGVTSHEVSEMSKRGLKKQKLTLKRGRQHKNKRSKRGAKDSQTHQAEEIIPGPKKSLKRRKLGADDARSTSTSRHSPPSSASKLARSSKSTNGGRPKAVKV